MCRTTFKILPNHVINLVYTFLVLSRVQLTLSGSHLMGCYLRSLDWQRMCFSIQWHILNEIISVCCFWKYILKANRDTVKSGNIRGTLIFANFAQNSASANSKTRENICDSLYAHFGHVGVVYWPCVLMQMGNILENVRPALFLCCPAACKCSVVWCQVFCAIQK